MRLQLEEWLRFVKADTHVLVERPHLFFQQASNQSVGSLPAEAAIQRFEAGLEKRPWLRWVNKPKGVSACVMTLEGHFGNIKTCKFSPDGSRIFSQANQSMKLWDVSTGVELVSFDAPGRIEYCGYSPDGVHVVTAADGTLTLWHAPNGAELTQLGAHTASVYVGAFSADGSYLATGSIDTTLKLWSVKDEKELCTLRGHSAPVTACAFSPDGTRIVSASMDHTLILWDALAGRRIAALTDHADEVNDCAFSPDGRCIASTSKDQSLKIWDANHGTYLASFASPESSGRCLFSPQSTRVACICNTSLQLRDLETTKPPLTLGGHATKISDCAFSPDGSKLVSAGTDGILKVWDTASGVELATLRGHTGWVNACAFSPDGSVMVSGSLDSTLKLWDMSFDRPSTDFEGHTLWVTRCAFSPDGARFVSSAADRTLKIWDAAKGEQLMTLRGHTGGVNDCGFSPDGTRILSAGGHNLKFWDAETGVELATLSEADSAVKICGYSPDGSRIISAGTECGLKIWNALTGDEVLTVDGRGASVTAFAMWPDGSRILTARLADATIRLCDTATGANLATLGGLKWHDEHECGYAVQYLAVSPDCTRGISASDIGELKLWEMTASSMRLLATLQCPRLSKDPCAIAPDSKHFAFALRTLKFSNLADGSERLKVSENPFDARLCLFSPDGQYLALGNDNWGITIVDVSAATVVCEFPEFDEISELTWSRNGKQVVAGCKSGDVHLLQLENIELDPPLVTARYLYHLDRDEWDEELTVDCLWCGVRLRVNRPVSGEQPISEGAEKTIECTNCSKPLRLNAFIVDNRPR